MAIVLPKDQRFLIGYRFPELIPFETNNVFLPMVLSPVFRLAVLEGRESIRGKPESISDIALSIQRFTQHPRVHGFDSPGGSKAAERIVQSSLIRTVQNLKTRRPHIDGLTPYSIAAFKVAFPSNLAGFRQVDRLIYSMLVANWDGDKGALRQYIEDVFGEGVEVRGVPKPSAARSSGPMADLDVMTELSIAYIEPFEPIHFRDRANTSYVPATPLPRFQRSFGSDIRRFWTSYAAETPRSLLIDQTITLIAFELTVMTLKLFHAIPMLTKSTEELPDAMSSADIASDPQIYVDWLDSPRHLSRTIAVACVKRDVGRVEDFTRSVLDLRYLHEVVKGLRSDREYRSLIDSHLGNDTVDDTPVYMRALLQLANHPDLRPEIRRESRSHIKAILSANQSGGDEDDDSARPASEADQFVQTLDDLGRSTVEQVQELLFAAQGTKAQSRNLSWLRDVGGVGTSYGLISGAANRRTWSYSPGNELLTVLVQLCAVDYEWWNPAKGAEPRGFGLAHFLEWLERRFGIIVDRPPADLGFDGPEHVTAARDNLQALLRRLRQMGMFEDQSDDFTVQQITPPFAEAD